MKAPFAVLGSVACAIMLAALGNNINHPNDFGHWIYYRVFSAIGL
jgi:hypothetical protein